LEVRTENTPASGASRIDLATRALMDDGTQVLFSRRIGSLEVTRSISPAAATPFAGRSSLDRRHPARRPADELSARQHTLAQ